ncbi:MAG: hypothetical protein EI684_23545 [Candidatus Viridilinea halotolerans]|uniref:Peptidase C-terminal archaeal/bacterial domain-containing protein n=1 Tax=Candidatus Viridilinea halotolerans TaxID=2491704 RepID=A0A426TQ51_9CHLR|nr:MAG: hypothetical protein EI684_23545 [Candidatus Viridilinea halotolerans]
MQSAQQRRWRGLKLAVVTLFAVSLLAACGQSSASLPTFTPEPTITPLAPVPEGVPAPVVEIEPGAAAPRPTRERGSGEAGAKPATARTAIAQESVEGAAERPPAQGGADDDAYEPDDRRSQANPIRIGEVQERTFGYEYDEDWVEVAVQADQMYVFETFDLDDGADTILTLYDEQGNELAYNDDDDGWASRIYHQVEDDGLLYLQVTAYSIDAPGLGYKLRVLEMEPVAPDAYEPDNSQAEAQAITVGEEQQRTFHYPQDEDWVAVMVTTGTAYHFETFDLDDGADTVLTLYNERGDELAYNDDFGSAWASRIYYQAENDERLYLQVSAYRGGEPGLGYKLRVVEAEPPAPDAYEPDNSQAEAKALALNEVQERTFHTPQDEDWVFVEVTAGLTYQFETLDLADGIDTVLTLYDAQGEELDSNDDYQSLASRIYYEAANTERLYLQVAAYRVDQPGLGYRLQMVEAAPAELDAYEPDDRQEEASSIQIGEIQDRTFHNASDEDWVMVEVEAGRTYRFATLDLDDGLDTVLTLYDERGEELAYNDDAEDSDSFSLASRITHEARNSGRLYLQVKTFGSAERGAAYRLEAALDR